MESFVTVIFREEVGYSQMLTINVKTSFGSMESAETHHRL